jgi:hypothetical protein
MTNYDKVLQTMTIDKLAVLIARSNLSVYVNCRECPIGTQRNCFVSGNNCVRRIKHWLESEVEENERS